MLGTAGEKAAQGREQLGLLQQKRVMPVFGGDLDKADIRRHRVQRMHHLAAFRGREQPVAGERDHAKARARAGKGAGQRALVLGRKVEIIHRPGDVEIGIGVEAVDKGAALVPQIALDLEIGVEAVGHRAPILQVAAELAVQGGFREIGDMRRHAGHGEPARWLATEGQITPAAPVGIGDDRLAPDFVKSDVLRRMARRGGDRHRGKDAFGIARRPLQHLHAAHRAADHAKQAVDAEVIEQQFLRPHHVAHGDDRERQGPGLAGRRVDILRAGGPHAAAQHVGAYEEIALGVEHPIGADQGLPPAGLAGDRVRVGGVLIAGQRVADEDRVRPLGVERAIGLVGDRERPEIDAAIEPQRLPQQQPMARPILNRARNRAGRCHSRHEDSLQVRREMGQVGVEFGGAS